MEHKVVLVSAAANGIGRAIARRMATEGAALWLASDEASNVTGICVRSNIRAASNRPD